jgi:hypothetical protein
MHEAIAGDMGKHQGGEERRGILKHVFLGVYP